MKGLCNLLLNITKSCSILSRKCTSNILLHFTHTVSASIVPAETETFTGEMLAGVDNIVCLIMFISGALTLHLTRLMFNYLTQHFRLPLTMIHPDNRQSVNEVRSVIHSNRSTPSPALISENNPSTNEETTSLIAPIEANEEIDNQICPICLDNIVYMVETNCRHCFCGSCFCAYWQHISSISPPNCPVCRGQLRFLIKRFNPDVPVSTISMEVRQDVDMQVNIFNRRFSGASVSLADQMRDLPTLLRYAFPSFIEGGQGISYLLRLRLLFLSLFVLSYLISPLDLIPESLMGIFGLLDDVVIVLLFCLYVAGLYRRHITTH